MKISHKQTGRTAALILLLQTVFLFSHAQVNYSSNALQMVVSGTSTLHDWDMKSSQGTCQAVFLFNNAGQITGLHSLVFSLPVANLKSGKSGMDNNAYKALKTDAHPSITYTLTSATAMPAEGGATLLKCIGVLSIAGKVISTDVVATCKVNADRTITVNGTKKLNMVDFNVTPPTFMMGTIKTGPGLTLNFNGLLKK